MVKEIRNAAELRENLLVSKVESLIEKCLNSKNMVSFFRYRSQSIKLKFIS